MARTTRTLLLLAVLFGLRPDALASEEAPLAFVTRDGQALRAGGKRLPLVGVNRYELAGGPQAALCQHHGGESVWWAWARGMLDNASRLKVSVVRLWAFQNYAGASGDDFSGLDQVVGYAKKKGLRLILTLENQWADCTAGGTKTAAWFREGHARPYGAYWLSFNAYRDAIVRHYRNEPTVAAWEIINEGKLYEAPAVLAQFLAKQAKAIRAISPHQLIIGGGALQCWQGRQGAVDFKAYGSAEEIDVLDFHDYDAEFEAWPACAEAALEAATQLDKPLLIGESGIASTRVPPAERGELFYQKLRAAMRKGAAGYLIWSLGERDGGLDGFDFASTSATGKALQRSVSQWPRR